ncbi:SAM-dependent methyltransferase [Oscillatoria sp. HE19RPO]|uniref:SAM-dependent methyltransferase n=1 Tax=Oscillatoria sp. HE19RPO TaxID=2954806 RepID=UPI0020C51408|nr:SAM-dependent methyltransferase [Oscillatoria sp. HE19RPO]
MQRGSLTIVGTGIQLGGHLTLAAQAWIKQADKLLFAVADPVTAKWLHTLNPTAEALPYNTDCDRRRQTYGKMVDRIMEAVRSGGTICAVFYGHPGVFADPAHGAIAQAKREGYTALMLPGISAEDCLFADIGIDPGKGGCQSFEATDFLIRQRKFDPNSHLILWQIALIGNLGFYQEGSEKRGLKVLAEVLQQDYPREHEVVIYEAAVYYPVCQPVINPIPLHSLEQAKVTTVSTLYVPPIGPASVDQEMMIRLGMIEG